MMTFRSILDSIRADSTIKVVQESIYFRQVDKGGVLILGLRPITKLLIQSRNLFTLALALPPKMRDDLAFVWRSNAGSLLPTAAAMVSMGN